MANINIRTAGNRAFGAAAPHLWNSLPANVVTSQSLATFKERLKHFLYSHATDSNSLSHLPLQPYRLMTNAMAQWLWHWTCDWRSRVQSQLLRCRVRPWTTVHTHCLWSSEISNKSSPTHPECSCSNCCPGSKIQTRHSYSEISSLASERIEYKIITLTYKILNTTQPSYLYLFSLLTVTTHALHLMSLSSNHHHHSKSLIDPSDASPHLWNQLPTSLRIPHPNYSSRFQRPSFELATLCYHLLSLFHCFTLSSKPTFSENLILHLSLFLSVGLISWL